MQNDLSQDAILSLSKRDKSQEKRFRSREIIVTDNDVDDIIVTDSESKTIYIKNFSETGKPRERKQIDTTLHERTR